VAAPGIEKLTAIGYRKARLLLAAVGLVVLAILAAILFVRRVDGVEVAATLLFLPILLAFVFFHAKGGFVAAVVASLTYTALRQPAIDAIGFDEFAGLIASRTVAYLVFGTIGGWAMQTLQLSLDKLDIYDQIDDETGLFNARFFVQDSELEIARSRRYKTLFTVAEVRVPTEALTPLGTRKAKAALRDLGRQVGESVRTVDRVAHAREGGAHTFLAVLPETAVEGGRIFGERFTDRVHGFLVERGCTIDREAVALSLLTCPGDDDALQELRRRMAAIDGLEHEHPVSV
jgi:GGDEF domain-containing protein